MPAQYYTVLRSLGGSGLIRGLKPNGTTAALEECGLEEVEKPRHEFDHALLLWARQDQEGAFLCLRCRASWPLEQAVTGMYRQYHQVYGLELAELAGFALDDVGHSMRFGAKSDTPIKRIPFPVEVVRSWDPEQAGLPHWARRLLEHRNDLKSYLKEQGVLLISTWALLADCSATQVRQAMGLTASKTALSAEEAVALHRLYLPLYRKAKRVYRQRTGRQRGWQPEGQFLRQVAPDQPPRVTQERLELIAAALRELLSGRWQQQERRLLGDDGSDLLEGVPDAAPTPFDLLASQGDETDLARKVAAAVNGAGLAYLQDMLESLPASEREQQLCFWSAWLKGQSSREIARHCQAAQAKVSRRMQVERRAEAIAYEALEELRPDPDFQDVFQSTEKLDAAAKRLANHLLQPEQEGEDPPLRRWLRLAMHHDQAATTPAVREESGVTP